MKDMETVANAVLLMDKQMREELFIQDGKIQTKKLWRISTSKNNLTNEGTAVPLRSATISAEWFIPC